MGIDRAAVQSALVKGFIGAPNTHPRLEDETKIDELVALLAGAAEMATSRWAW
jgi:hypothetical protein